MSSTGCSLIHLKRSPSSGLSDIYNTKPTITVINTNVAISNQWFPERPNTKRGLRLKASPISKEAFHCRVEAHWQGDGGGNCTATMAHAASLLGLQDFSLLGCHYESNPVSHSWASGDLTSVIYGHVVTARDLGVHMCISAA